MTVRQGLAQSALVTGLLLLALPSFAVEYGGIGGKPAYPRVDNPRTESIFVHTLEPGTTQDEGVLVSNNSSEDQVLQVYAVDSASATDGAFACAQENDAKVDVGTWITLEQTEITLSAGTQATVPFKISVPESVDVGEHNGCIVIQKKADAGTSNGSGLNLSFRSAIRVAVTVPGDIVRSLAISDFSYSAAEQDHLPTLNFTVINDGNVSIDADTAIVTKNVFGQEYFKHGGTYPVLRADTAQWNYELPNSFWGGWFQSTATVTYDAHAEASLGQDSGLEKTVLTQQTAWFFLPPARNGLWIEITIVLAVFILVIGTIIIRRRQRQVMDQWVDYTIKTGEDLEMLAKQYHIAWQRLAKLNRLKAPYRLKAGDHLKVPPSSHAEPNAKSKR